MNLDAELFTLQDSNSKLVAALHEANANVEQWKKQLVAYQEETERLRDQVSFCYFMMNTNHDFLSVMTLCIICHRRYDFGGTRCSFTYIFLLSEHNMTFVIMVTKRAYSCFLLQQV